MSSPMTQSQCLTRWVSDDEFAVEVAQLQKIMERIQSALHEIPQRQRSYIANALLNLAVAKMIKEEGRPRTSTLLLRLSDVLASGTMAEAHAPVDLSRTDG